MEFTNIGAGWIKKEEGKPARISVKLENGVFLTIFKNTKKVEGSNQPDYNLTMKKEDAEAMGLVKVELSSAILSEKEEEIDIEEIPF